MTATNIFYNFVGFRYSPALAWGNWDIQYLANVHDVVQGVMYWNGGKKVKSFCHVLLQQPGIFFFYLIAHLKESIVQ